MAAQELIMVERSTSNMNGMRFIFFISVCLKCPLLLNGFESWLINYDVKFITLVRIGITHF